MRFLILAVLLLTACTATPDSLQPQMAYVDVDLMYSQNGGSPQSLEGAELEVDTTYRIFAEDVTIRGVTPDKCTYLDDDRNRLGTDTTDPFDYNEINGFTSSVKGMTSLTLQCKIGNNAYEDKDSFTVVADQPEPEESYLDILSEVEGFGEATTGGADGEVITVTNLNDKGAGSLREAVAMSGPKWIVFEEGLTGTINLSSALKVESNKTIDGRGADITLSGDTLQVTAEDNIIVTHLKFDGSTSDAIRIRQGSSNIWIHQNSLSSAGDGLIDVISGSKDITISWNKFSDHGLTMLLGRDGEVSNDNLTVTLHHNFFDRTNERNPKANRGKVHSYNNYIYDWRYVGAFAEDGGEIYSEANIYEAVRRTRASNYANDNPGYLKSVNDLMENGAFHKATGASQVFTPSNFYSYQADTADASLKTEIMSGAGWQQTSSFATGQ